MADPKQKVHALAKRLENDPTARMKLLSRLADVLTELGVDPKELKLLPDPSVGWVSDDPVRLSRFL